MTLSYAGRVEGRMTVPTGGASVTASLGSLSSAVTVTIPSGTYFHTATGGVSSLATTLQNALQDQVQGYPGSAAAMQAAIGYGNWTAGWLMNEASGNLIGSFGGVNLTPVSTPTYGNAGPVGATTASIDKAVGFDSTLDAFSGGNVLDANGTDDLVIAAVCAFPSIANADIVSKGFAGASFYALHINPANQISMRCGDGTHDISASAAISTGTWYAIIGVVERGVGLRVGLCPLGGAPTVSSVTSIALLGSMTNASNFLVGDGGGYHAPLGGAMSALYVGKGTGIASGLCTNLSAAVQNFANAVYARWTVSLDATSTTATGRYTISNSGWPCSVNFTNTSLRDVLGYAYDFDYPRTAAQVTAALGGLGNFTNGVGYLLDEAAGNPASVFGTPASLTATTLTYSNQAARGGADKAIGFSATTSNADGGNALNVTATDDLIIVWVGYFSAWPAAQSSIVSKGWAPGWILNAQATGEVTMSINDGTTSRAPNSAANGTLPREWHVGIAVIDRSVAQVRVGTYGLTSGTNTVGTAASTSTHGSLSNATAFRLGADASAVLVATTALKLGAVYVATGAGVATGLAANLSTALSNFATYMKSQTSTKQARGLWFPSCPLNLDGDPSQAPRVTDKRSTVGPTGQVFSLVGNSFRRHTGVQWPYVPKSQVWESAATYTNGSFETFANDCIFGLGHAWFSPSSPLQIYWDDAGTSRALGYTYNSNVGVAGWSILNLNSNEPKLPVAQWSGLFNVTFGDLVAVE